MPYLSPSTLSRFVVRLLFAAALALPACAVERNLWPLWVGTEDETSGRITAMQAFGPLFAERQLSDGATQQAWRPIFLWQGNEQAETAHLLYPFFSWQKEGEHSSFTFFQLINHRRSAAANGTAMEAFDVWPFYFSRRTGDPTTSYRALLPVAGTIKYRFGKDELSWVAFPLYFKVEKAGMRTQHTPWPIVRRIDGDGHHGFEVWPLFGRRGRQGDYRAQFYLWPLIYKQEKNLSAEQPDVKQGFLPFYTRDTGRGFLDENYLWPFFGHTDRSQPQRYREIRYFWPLLVQGRGEVRHINRWAPFYTHSIVKGYDKSWVMWPLFRQARWADGDVAQERNQFLYFLYWSTVQRSVENPATAPAYKKHVWPLLSVWDNGAGRRQWQMLSPLEVFFPQNEPVRQLYTPLFALFRYDQQAPGHVRWSLLWNAVSSRRTPEEREFHLGPLFSKRRTAAGERVALGAGLLSWHREVHSPRWRFSLFDFGRTPAKPVSPAASP